MSAHSSRRILISFCLTLVGLVAGAFMVFSVDAAGYSVNTTGTVPVNWTALAWGCATVGPTDSCGPYPGAQATPFGNNASILGNSPVIINTLLANPFSLNTNSATGINIQVLPGGTATLLGTSQITGTSGSNSLSIAGGTLTNNGTLQIQSIGIAQNLVLAGGTFNGTGTTTIGPNGTFAISGTQGPMTLNQSVTNNNLTSFTATANALTIAGVTFTNNSNFNVSSANGVINNGGGGQLNNASNFTFPTSGGTFTANLPFNNTGTVTMTSTSGPQTLNLNGGGFHSGAASTWNFLFPGHTLNFAGAALGHNFSGTQSFIGTSGQVNFTGGTIGIDTNMTIPFPVSNSADLRVGTSSTPALSIVGNFTQNAAGIFTPKINGPGLGQYGRVNVTGNATLAGNMSALLGYTPTTGDFFDVMSWLTRSGTMVYTPASYPGGRVVATYQPTLLRLVAVPAVDIGVSKTGPASVLRNQTVTYTIRVQNFSANPATNIVIRDAYSSGTLNSANVPTGSCTPFSPSVVDCTIPTLAPGAFVDMIVVLNATVTGSINNQAIVFSLSESDTNSANDLAGAVTAVNPASDLSITKTGAPATVAAGANVTYTLTVSNAGPDLASSVTVTDALPPGFTLVSSTGTGWSCSGSPTVTCNLAASLAPSTSANPITIVATAPASAGSFTNTAQVGPTSSDPFTGNNSASVATTVTATADLAIVKTLTSLLTAGSNATYSITVTNNGPSTSSAIVITDPTPPNMTFVSNTGACTTSFPCTFASLASGASATINTTFAVAAGATGSISNTATVSSSTPDPNSGNDSSTATGTVGTNSDVSITKNGPGSINAGQNLTFNVVVTNNGPSTATGVLVSDTTPANTTFVSNTGACTTAYPCSLGALSSGQSVSISSTYLVSPTATGSISNAASVSSTSTDATPGNNTSTSVVPVIAATADLDIVKTGPASVNAGQNLTFNVVVTNNGPFAATGVVVSDSTPANTTFVSNTGACTTAYPCSLGTLSPGQTVTISSTYLVSPTASGSIFNTASVSGTPTDPSPGNNSATSAVPVIAGSADLEIVKSGPATLPSGTVVFSITVKNLGASNAFNVVVNDPTPTGLTFVSNSGNCNTTYPCNFGSMASGQTKVITSTYNVNSGTTSITNTASVSSTTPDPRPGNNSSTVTLTANVCPSDAPIQIVPAEGSIDAPVNGSISWTNVARDYEVYFGRAGAGCNTLFATTSSSSIPYSGLLSGQEYESRIVATGKGCAAPLSSRCVKWRTAGGCTLEAPMLLAPAAGATGRPSPVTFSWTRVDNAELYTLFVGVNGVTPAEVGTTADTSFSTNVATGPVAWHVVASSRTCASARSANGQFDSCSSPATPLAGVEGAPISGTLYSVVWDAVPGATRYEVDEAQNPAFTGLTTQSTTNTRMSFSHRTVGSAAVYFYRVRAFGACTNIASANSRTVRVVILPPVPTSSLNVPVGGREKIKHLIFIPGETDASYNYIATTDKPWVTVQLVAGVLQQFPGGVTLEAEVDPTDLPNGTFTGTVILALIPISSGGQAPSPVSHAATAKSQPISVNLVTPVKPGDVSSPTADTLIIPSVGHLAGINSLWRSDIRILNTAGAKAKYQLDFITSGAEDVKQTIIEVDANGTTALDDIVHNWYGFGEVGDSANGILQIRPLNSGGQTPSSVRTGEAPVLHDPNAISSSLTTAASSRTYSTSANGTLGQFIPAVQFGNFIGKTGVLSLQQIAQSVNFRTNVGVVEAAGKPVSVLLSIFNSSGSKLMDVPLDLKAGEQKQLNGFLATNGITLDDGRVEVRVTDGDGKVTAYASVVDNRSIDPLLVAAVPLGGTTSQRWVLPGVADLNTGSASWRTDMRVFNAGSTPQTATLTFHPQNNASAPQSTNITVQPGEVKVLNSVLVSLFSARDVGGAIHVLTANPSQLTVTGRTYNQTSNGTFGQFIPAVTSTEGADRASRALNILQVEDSVRYRTNIGIAEITGNPATVEVTVNLPDSKITPKVEIPLAANEFRQFAIIRELGLQNIYNARVTVKVISGTGAVTAYGSVIDMVSTDPTYVPAQ